MGTARRICVYCASSKDVGGEFFADAESLGVLLARNGYETICGAGNEGLMKRLADSALSAGGKVTGVIPEFMEKNGWMHPGLSQTIITPDIHTRKQRMAEMADAAIALPGGCGTMEELLEIITWKQLGLFGGGIVILNTAGFYDPLIAMLHKAVDGRFMKPSHKRLWQIAGTPGEAVALIAALKPSAVEPKRQ